MTPTKDKTDETYLNLEPRYVAKALEKAGYDVFRVREGLREAGLPFAIFDAFLRAALSEESNWGKAEKL